MGKMSTFADIESLESCDVRRLAALNPHTVKTLLNGHDKTHIAKFFPFVDALISLRRNSSSRIPRDEAATRICEMRKLIKPHYLKTKRLERHANEQAEFQWLYRDAAK